MSRFTKLFSKDEQQHSDAITPPKPQPTAAEYCERGQKSLKAGKCVEAMEYFQAAIETDKRFEKAYLLLATAYEKQGKTDKAKAALYALLAVEPNNKNALGRIDELNGKQVIIKTPTSQKPSVKPKSVSLSTKQPKTKQKTKAGEISFKVTKCFWILLCLTIILFSFVLASAYSMFDYDDGIWLAIVIILWVDDVIIYGVIYKLLYLLLYRRDNWKGEKFGKDNYNPIVYNLVRNIIYIASLSAAIIALIYWVPYIF